MKRTDITDIFPEATKEQIDKLMALNGADINGAKSELETLRQQLTEQNGKDDRENRPYPGNDPGSGSDLYSDRSDGRQQMLRLRSDPESTDNGSGIRP